MKKFLSLLLSAALLLALLGGCTAGEPEDTVNSPDPTAGPSSSVVPTDPVQEPSLGLPSDEPTTDPGDEPTTDPGDEPTTDPGDEPTTDPGNEPTTKPGDEPTTKPGDEPTTKPDDKPTTKPDDKPTTDPGDEPTTDPGDESTTDPGDEPTTDPGDEPTTDPGDEPTTDPGDDPSPSPSIPGGGNVTPPGWGGWGGGLGGGTPEPTPEETPVKPTGRTDSDKDLDAFYKSLIPKSEDEDDPDALLKGMDVDPLDDGYMTNKAYGWISTPCVQRMAYMSKASTLPNVIALIQVNSASEVAAVKAILNSWVEAEAADPFGYNPLHWQQNARVVSEGNYVMMIVSGNCDAVVDAFYAFI